MYQPQGPTLANVCVWSPRIFALDNHYHGIKVPTPSPHGTLEELNEGAGKNLWALVFTPSLHTIGLQVECM